MSLLIGFLTFFMVMNCLFLMLLILIQLPKKEAGAGIAFGGAATDALFGAGSGNALTNMTKYSASIFVGFSVLLSVLNMHQARAGSRRLEQELSRQASATPIQVAPAQPTNMNVQVVPPPVPTMTSTSVTAQAAQAAPAIAPMTSTATNLTAPTPTAPTAPAPATPEAPANPAPAPTTPK